MTTEADKPVVNIADVPLVDRGHGEKFAVSGAASAR